MSLQFIIGRSGAGKTHYLASHILEESKLNPDTRYLLIVPEQYSLQMKRDMVAMSGEKGILNVDALSFMRLAYRVFEEKAGVSRTILDDVGTSMILRRILIRTKKELNFFKGVCDKVGFVGEVKSILSEFVQYGVEEEDMEEMIRLAKEKPMLKGKLEDVRILYREFRKAMANDFLTAEEAFDVLGREVGESDAVRGSVACIDGFMGFTPSQYELLAELMKTCKKVYVTVTADPNEDYLREGEKHELFYNSRKHIRRCWKLAVKNHVRVEEPHVVGMGEDRSSYRLADRPALQAIERHLFRYPLRTISGKPEGLQIRSLASQESEVRFVVKETMRLIREEGYRYRDIAVVTGDIGAYGVIAEWEMRKAGVPCFVDNKREVTSNAFVEAILSIVETLRKDFDYESLFRFLRCGFTDFGKGRIDRMENRVLAKGIRGFYRYQTQWEELYQYFLPLKEAFSGGRKTVGEYTKALYGFMEKEMKGFERIEARRKELEERGEVVLAKEYEQIYSIVVELLESLVELMGEETVSIKEYGELLKAGLFEARVGLVPLAIDQVVVGDVERSRLKDVKALFFIGMNEGVVPKRAGGGGILSDIEREYFLDRGRELAPSERDRLFLQQFYLYLNLTKPKERLYISYARLGTDGKPIGASPIVGKLRGLFPEAPLIEREDDPLGADMGLRYLAEGMRRYAVDEVEAKWKEVYRYHFQRQDNPEFLRELVKGAFYQRKDKDISKGVAHELYEGGVVGSVSRMENYAACSYAHFLHYGLRLRERQEYVLSMMELGEVFHRLMERFSEILKKKGSSWRKVTKDEVKEWTEEALLQVKEELQGGLWEDSMRNAYALNRVRRIGKWAIQAMCEQAGRGRFEEAGVELRFDEGLRGRIDRVEVCEEGDARYVKVVDFKTGDAQIDLTDLYYGLQIQLVVYMDQAMKYVERLEGKGKAVVPAGMMYYRIKDPVIDRAAYDKEGEWALLKEMLPSGVFHNDKHVVSLMDKGVLKEDGSVAPNYQSLAIPLKTTKDGAWAKNDYFVEEEALRGMLRYVNDWMEGSRRRIMEGDVKVNPYKKKGKTACERCPYQSVCGFDKRLPDNRYRELGDVDVVGAMKEWGRGDTNEVDG